MAVLEGRLAALPAPVTYGHAVDEEILAVAEALSKEEKLSGLYAPEWLAAKLIERDEAAIAGARAVAPEALEPLLALARDAAQRMERHFHLTPAPS